MEIPADKKIYFASDFHLGADGYLSSKERELQVISWLNEVSKDAHEIYLLGDVFDFWFEYQSVVPKGYVRLLGKLAELSDKGIKIKVFTGNHDMWMFGYLKAELGVEVVYEPIEIKYNDSHFYIGHGDGLGPGDYSYKLLKILFSSKICQWLLSRFHPNLTFKLANRWSKKSRISNLKSGEKFEGKENEWLYQFSKSYRAKKPIDYFIIGHRHLVLDLTIEGTSSRYINLGEWVTGKPHYAVFNGKELALKPYQK